MAIMSALITLLVLAGLALLFGLMANFVFKRSSPVRRAAYAAAALAILLSIPAYVALLSAEAPAVSLAAIAVGTAILFALAFPLALLITRRKPAPADQSVFD